MWVVVGCSGGKKGGGQAVVGGSHVASSAGCGGSGKEGGRQVILAAAAKHKAGIQGRIVEARRIQGKVAEALSTARIMAYTIENTIFITTLSPHRIPRHTTHYTG